MALQSKAKIAFDSNMLLAIAQFKVDVFSQLRQHFGSNVQYAMPEQVGVELEKLGKKSKTVAKAVGVAIAAAKRNGVKKIKLRAQHADAALAKMAKKGFYVATNDAKLRKTIKGFGGKSIYLRKTKFLAIE